MEDELTALAGRRETTCHEEKERERADTDLEFSSRFSVVVLRTCLLVLSSHVRVWCETSLWSSPQDGSRNFRLSLHFRGWYSTRVFTS